MINESYQLCVCVPVKANGICKHESIVSIYLQLIQLKKNNLCLLRQAVIYLNSKQNHHRLLLFLQSKCSKKGKESLVSAFIRIFYTHMYRTLLNEAEKQIMDYFLKSHPLLPCIPSFPLLRVNSCVVIVIVIEQLKAEITFKT